jgi:hypothetical protein
MGDVTWDTAQLNALESELGKVNGRVMDNVVKAMAVTSFKIKEEARTLVKGRHLPHLAQAINYDDPKIGWMVIRGEVGVDGTGPQGGIGAVIEGGSPYRPDTGGGNAPMRFMARATESNVEDFVTGLQKAVLDGLR